MRLLDLQPGESAIIAQINEGQIARKRLYEIGMVPGAAVQIVSRHPFQGPLVLRLGNAEFALGRNLARLITVDKN